MMKIALDARFALGVRRGIGVYSLNLIRQLASLDTANEFFLFTASPDNDHELPNQANFRVVHVRPSFYPIWEQLMFPLNLAREKFDILHCLGNTAPLWLPSRLKFVLTLHDVSYLESYDKVPRSQILYQRLGRHYRKFVAPIVARHAQKIIAVSEFAKRDIVQKIDGINADSVTVTHLAPHAIYQKIDRQVAKAMTSNKFGINSPFLLTLGGRDPQKNVAFTLKGFLELKRSRVLTQKLVVVGISGDALTPYRKIVADSGCSQNEVTFIEFVQPEDLVYLYNAAELFIFASLYESFGIPPLEALACGVPAILSNRGALPEISGDAALYFDTSDPSSFKDAVLKGLRDSQLRECLSQRGQIRASEFSWSKLAKQTLSIYQCI